MDNYEARTEELAKELSLKLADKLEKGEITMEKMTQSLGDFFNFLTNKKPAEEIKQFIDAI
jgi:hypothetical protein